MIPIKLTLRGFLSYREETVIDFAGLEVACISGANGAGKSSLFDAITWALFGRARRNDDDALINDALKKTDKGGCRVVLEFDYEANQYRVERYKENGKATQLEFQVRAAEGWKALTESGLRATEERIREALHLDYDTFINSAFFLQGKADLFTQQNPGRRKEILGSILGLEIWEAYREETARRRRAQEGELALKHNLLNEIQAELAQESERREKLTLFTQSLEKTAALRAEKEASFNRLQTESQRLKSDQEKLDMLTARLDADRRRAQDADEQINLRQAELSASEAVLQREQVITQAYQAWLALRENMGKWDALAERYHAVQSDRSRLEAELQAEEARLRQEQRYLLDRQQEIEKIRGQQAALQKEISAEKRKLDELEAALKGLPLVEEKLSTLQAANSELRAVNLRLKDSMDELKRDIATLESAGGSQCPLCGQSLTAEHRADILAQLNRQGKEAGERFRENSRLVKENEAEQAGLKDRQAELRRQQPALAALQRSFGQKDQLLATYHQSLENWQRLEEPRLQEINAVLEKADFSAPVRVQLSRADDSLQALGYNSAEHERLRREERAARDTETDFRKLEAARAALDSLRREIGTLQAGRSALVQEITQNESTRAELAAKVESGRALLPDLESAEAELMLLRQEENSLRQQVGAAQQMLDVLEKQRQRQAAIEQETAEIQSRIADLKALETAFGKDGIPALLIEQALPEIEMQANEVLDRLSDGRMSITFITERVYKDKKREDKKQTLDILISDSAGQREYELFSGGEAFRINFAIRLALSRVLAGRAGARLQTLVIDEGFGSQDAEGRQRLIEAINLVRRDFAKILVITHLDELKDAFPSRIEVQKTAAGSTVEVFP